MTLAAGAKLGPYEVLAPIGEGGMGVVYRARDPRLDRQVAIKLLRAGVVAEPHARERLRAGPLVPVVSHRPPRAAPAAPVHTRPA